ncbi:MAG: pyridoxal-phosphate dependent enzyme [Bacteroidota bacterium]|nr:pyridoxal-phosphate dependent enzyme [Candidatus Kapabacteria bacterium]MDW8219879.1 pyridoxal-phosphate dependent enzyme [Bacteroidota bacterium]
MELLCSDIEAAHQRIKPYIHRTPIMTSRLLNQQIGCELFFKCENFQKAGAFKARGAFHAVYSLSDEEASRGVVTHSSGNHAAALALAARTRGIPAYIVMPENSSPTKQRAVRAYGGNIILCGPTQDDRETTAERVLRETAAVLIHPYNDMRIIAGQATCAKELLEDIADIDMILAPVSGGGLLSGTALAVSAMCSPAQVIGCEPEEADDAFRSYRDGVLYPAVTPPRTICDGLRTSLGTLTFPIIRTHVAAIHTVSEQATIHAMRTVWEVMKILIEPSCAVSLAVLLEGKLDVHGKRVGIILSGGNVDLDTLPWQ